MVWHWTAGRCGPRFAEALAYGIKTYTPKDRAASWHLIIAKDGPVTEQSYILKNKDDKGGKRRDDEGFGYGDDDDAPRRERAPRAAPATPAAPAAETAAE